MKNLLITDTGFWYALINGRDAHHRRASDFLANCNRSLVTTWPVMTETCYLLQRRMPSEVVATFLGLAQRQVISVVPLDNGHTGRMAELILQYQDLPMDLADASLVVLAEILGHGDILSTDRRDFQAYRWKNRKPFRNLLFPDD